MSGETLAVALSMGAAIGVVLGLLGGGGAVLLRTNSSCSSLVRLAK